MRRFVPAILLVLAVLGFEAVGAQKTGGVRKGTSTRSKNSAAKTTLVEAPPQAEDIPAVLPSLPPLNFDTTASPEDTLTARIRTLLSLTRALESDIQLAERSLNESLGGEMADNALVQSFKKRFMEEMREGRARRWLTSLYIRQYRSIFTADEIKTLIEFYLTPQGNAIMKKQVQLYGSIMTDARKIGEYLGGTLMQEIIKEQSKN